MNLFYLSGYVGVGVTTAFVMRRLGGSRLIAIVVSVLFALVPYHWLRGEGHLFLSMYWILPLVLLVLVWLDSPTPPFINVSGKGRLPLEVRAPHTIAALVIMVVAGGSGVYYVFFSCFFIVVVGLRATIRRRDYRPALAALLLVLVGACVVAVQMAPSAVYSERHGKNTVVAVRTSVEAEIYGLRITQLLLPIPGHRVPQLAAKQAYYLKVSPGATTEAMFASLGIVGSLGFLATLAAILFCWPRDQRDRLIEAPEAPPQRPGLRWFGMLTVAAVLLGTVAGFGAVFAALVTPQIRAYNRISIFIALFAFVTLGLVADRFLRLRTGRRWRTIATFVIIGITLFAVLDQTPRDLSAAPHAAQADYAAADAFGTQVQATVPAGSAFFQLPYMAFPEYGSVLFPMNDYAPLAGYVHTTGFRWSYGAMKGRPDAAWQEATAALPPAAMIAHARAAGFGALWVQLNGYKDGGLAIRADLERLLGAPALVRQDGVIAVWLLK